MGAVLREFYENYFRILHRRSLPLSVDNIDHFSYAAVVDTPFLTDFRRRHAAGPAAQVGAPSETASRVIYGGFCSDTAILRPNCCDLVDAPVVPRQGLCLLRPHSSFWVEKKYMTLSATLSRSLGGGLANLQGRHPSRVLLREAVRPGDG